MYVDGRTKFKIAEGVIEMNEIVMHLKSGRQLDKIRKDIKYSKILGFKLK